MRAVVCLLLVVKRKAYSLVKGNVIWQRMEANNLCGGHRYTTLLHNTLQDAFWTNLYSINETVLHKCVTSFISVYITYLQGSRLFRIAAA